ncbi:response regulator [Sessilibacter corallicola]|uniref:Response regulator AgmR n=1 Tax=Sessilibacter corallicola TaxID=2904075 RepID=A0ABQ0A732_9GAMM|nr:response regulator transcription factor [Sessilibacter corallicola]MCE2028435.1 response regulator transcription factor [Sessilibacter corallicola]
MYKILIADDHPLFRFAIASVLEKQLGEVETLYSHDFESTLEAAENCPELDLILLDLNMPGMEGLNGIVQLRNRFAATPVVVVSAEEGRSVVLQAMTYGAVGFITKSTDRAQIGEAIEKILDGQVYLPPDVIRNTDEKKTSGDKPIKIEPELLAKLSKKELQVYEVMAKGGSNKQIAYELNIAEATVKSHVSSILRKLNVTNRVQAILQSSTDAK